MGDFRWEIVGLLEVGDIGEIKQSAIKIAPCSKSTMQSGNRKGLEWGVMIYDTTNLGDDIQSLAAQQFLPQVDRYVMRDKLKQSCGANREVLLCILNGWFMWGKEWPPGPSLHPLLISFHISNANGSRSVMETSESIEWLKKWSPVGCRSMTTLTFLREKGVDCYFSGCLTLTLKRPDVAYHDKIVFVDTSRDHVRGWDDRTKIELMGNSIAVTHDCQPGGDPLNRLMEAKKLLDLYAGARVVVTRRLHVALPCVAFGVPVVFIRPSYEFDRVEPYLKYMSITLSEDDFKRQNFKFDWWKPFKPAYPEELIGGLVRRTSEWVSSIEINRRNANDR